MTFILSLQQNGVCVSPTSSNNARKQGRNNHDPAQLKRSKSQGSRKLISCKAQSVCSESGNGGPGEGTDFNCMGGLLPQSIYLCFLALCPWVESVVVYFD